MNLIGEFREVLATEIEEQKKKGTVRWEVRASLGILTGSSEYVNLPKCFPFLPCSYRSFETTVTHM